MEESLWVSQFRRATGQKGEPEPRGNRYKGRASLSGHQKLWVSQKEGATVLVGEPVLRGSSCDGRV